MSHRDLVTRLRAMATGGWSHLPNAKTAGEAADVIEGLSEALAAAEQREREDLIRDRGRALNASNYWKAEHLAGNDEIDRLRALLTAVAESGVEWSTPGYVVVQVDRATWAAITGAPAPACTFAVSGFDFPPEAS